MKKRERTTLMVGKVITACFGLAVPGCIVVPLVEAPRTPSGKNIRSIAGSSQSDRFFREGITTRNQVIDELGTPKYRSGEDQALGYSYQVDDLWIISPFNPSSGPYIFPMARPYFPATWYLFLAFDRNGTLRHSETCRAWGYLPHGDDRWQEFVHASP